MEAGRRYALITGAGSGLGRQLAVHLARQGWHIGIADLHHIEGEATRRLVEDVGGTGEFLELDVRVESQWEALRDDLHGRWPRLDMLINNAGVSASGEVGQSPIEDWDWILEINLRGVILGCHTMVGWLRCNPERSYILNIASAAAILCGPGMAAYNVSKAGVMALSESLYVELKGHNVGVTVACPWFIKTNLLKSGRFAHSSHRGFAEQAMAKARITPEIFAEQALKATFANHMVVVPGMRPWLAVTLKRWFPQTVLNLIHRHVSKSPAPSDRDPQEIAEPAPAVASE